MTAPKILIIDDDDTVLSTLTLILKRSGYEVLTSRRVTCLDLIFREEPALILLDVQMPGIDGETAAAILTRERQGIKGKIVFHSAHDASILDRMARTAGIDGFICKTAGIHELIRQVESFIGPGTGSRVRPATPVSPPRRLTPPPFEAPPRNPPAVKAEPASPSGARRILLVDSDESYLRSMRTSLRAMSVDAETTTSSFCTNQILLQKPELVVLGIEVQGISGEILASIIRSVPGLPPTMLILLVSARSEKFDTLVREGRIDAVVVRSSDWVTMAHEILQELDNFRMRIPGSVYSR